VDSSRHRKIVYALRTNGFVPVRKTTHGILWGRYQPPMREAQFVLVDRRGPAGDPRAYQNFRAVMRRLGISL